MTVSIKRKLRLPLGARNRNYSFIDMELYSYLYLALFYCPTSYGYELIAVILSQCVNPHLYIYGNVRSALREYEYSAKWRSLYFSLFQFPNIILLIHFNHYSFKLFIYVSPLHYILLQYNSRLSL